MEAAEDLKNPVKCKYCPKEFNRNSHCKRHMKNVHKRNGNGELIEDTEEISFSCVFCNKKYCNKFNLQRHVNNVHLETKKSHKCENCDFCTNDKSSLKRHNLRVHCSSKQIPKLQCTECKAKFRRQANLKYHERKVHKIGQPKFQIRRKCPLCKYTAIGNKKDDIYKHFEVAHDIKVTITNLKFHNMNEFTEWKSNIEKQTTSSFVKTFASPSITNFQCHRCGTYKSKGKNLRNLKLSGSCKIGGFCPAAVKLKSNGDLFDVVYTSTHVGHQKEPKHMRLTKEEKKKIALQLAAKVPHKEILKCIRSSLTNSDLSRLHLTNKKDIINIENSFNLNKESKRPSLDSVSIEAWVSELSASPNTVLLIYKPQGVLSDCENLSHLKENDFLLIYMSMAQKEMLQTYGNDVICIDSTHGLNNYNLQLFSLLTFDQTREGFPVAFMFTNRGDKEIMQIFFEQIKAVMGQVNCRIFMSDIEESFYAAWSKVMGNSSYRLFCAWHVLRAWRKSINLKIKNNCKRKEVFKTLQTLMCELDDKAFKQMLDKALIKLHSDEDTLIFKAYFEDNFVSNNKYILWAYCFRLHAGINTNMSMDNFNKVLKHCYLQGKHVKRLEKTLCTVLNLLRDKLFDLFSKFGKEKLVSKIQMLKKQHKSSFHLDFETVMEEGPGKWQVLSETSTVIYSVRLVNAQCSGCQLKCSYCESCFHMYLCSCIDSAIKNNMCKHIHLIGRREIYLKGGKLENEAELQEDSTNLTIDSPSNDSITDQVLHTLSLESEEHFNLEHEKEVLRQQFNNLLSGVNSKDQIKYLKQEMKKIEPTLQTMKASEGMGFQQDFWLY